MVELGIDAMVEFWSYAIVGSVIDVMVELGIDVMVE